MKKPLLIGLGQRFRSDDAVGPYIVESLNKSYANAADFSVMGDAANLLDLWEGRDLVFLVDAVEPEIARPGSIFRLDGLKENFPLQPNVSSSHVLGLNEALELGRILQRLPRQLQIYGIAGASFDYGELLSEAVLKAADEVIAEIGNKLGKQTQE